MMLLESSLASGVTLRAYTVDGGTYDHVRFAVVTCHGQHDISTAEAGVLLAMQQRSLASADAAKTGTFASSGSSTVAMTGAALAAGNLAANSDAAPEER